MIRINLLSEEERREIKGITEFLLGVAVIVGMIVVLVAVDFNESSKISGKQRELNRLKKEIKNKEAVKARVEDFKRQNKLLEQRIRVIQVLEENRAGPLFVMDSLGKAIPERAWVNKFTEKGFIATMEGVAWNEKTVAEFMRNLQASPYFKAVSLKEIKTKRIQTLDLKTYKIQTRLNYSGKTDKPKPGTNAGTKKKGI
ncbi:MAG: PilN domain-containing protein [Candidatus Dadabacteria bacterium]|nr:PilN domain-containing protein [Candidatus Dadabacteria bacterium]